MKKTNNKIVLYISLIFIPFYNCAMESSNNDILIKAIREDNQDTFNSLLSQDIDVNKRSRDCKIPLIMAIYLGRTQMVHQLLEHGTIVNPKNPNEEIPLLTAAVWNDTPSIVADLLAHSANINAKGASGENALIRAARHGKTAVVETLLENGIQLNEKDAGGNTALDWARENHHHDIVRLLRRYGAKSCFCSCKIF